MSLIQSLSDDCGDCSWCRFCQPATTWRSALDGLGATDWAVPTGWACRRVSRRSAFMTAKAQYDPKTGQLEVGAWKLEVGAWVSPTSNLQPPIRSSSSLVRRCPPAS